jgi:condensin complex subunit 2
LRVDGVNEDWKKYSATLEAGSKIYGFRVDSAHSEAYKILGEMARAEKGQGEEEPADQAGGKKKQETASRRVGGGDIESTLEKNEENLNTNKYDLEFEMDPLFKITSAKFDAGGIQGLLLNHLQVALLYHFRVNQQLFERK